MFLYGVTTSQVWHDVKNTDYPSGCYYKLGTTFNNQTLKEFQVFFNKKVDPSTTINENFGDRGGICTNIGKCNLNVCCNHIFIQY